MGATLSEELQTRYHELVDKKLEGRLRPAEASELQKLIDTFDEAARPQTDRMLESIRRDRESLRETMREIRELVAKPAEPEPSFATWANNFFESLSVSTAFAKAVTTNFDHVLELALKTREATPLAEVSGDFFDLPHAISGKVAVLADSSEWKTAKAAGAEVTGGKGLMKKLAAGKAQELGITDIVVSDEFAPLPKTLKLHGSWFQVKNENLGAAIRKANRRRKRVKARRDEFGVIHVPVGTTGQDAEQVVANSRFVVDSLLSRNAGSGGKLEIVDISLRTSMRPGMELKFAVEPASLGVTTPEIR